MITEKEIEKIVEDSRENINRKYNPNTGIFLSDKQIQILRSRFINYNQYTDMKTLIYEIEDYLMYQEDEELESLSQELSEYDYYHNYKK